MYPSFGKGGDSLVEQCVVNTVRLSKVTTQSKSMPSTAYTVLHDRKDLPSLAFPLTFGNWSRATLSTELLDWLLFGPFVEKLGKGLGILISIVVI